VPVCKRTTARFTSDVTVRDVPYGNPSRIVLVIDMSALHEHDATLPLSIAIPAGREQKANYTFSWVYQMSLFADSRRSSDTQGTDLVRLAYLTVLNFVTLI
jgi:hypothetical protein